MVVVTASCSGSTDPSKALKVGDSVILDGVRYSAVVASVPLQPPALSGTLTMENIGTGTVSLRLAAECPVYLRFYHILDNRLLFDESKRPCDTALRTTIQLGSGQQRSIGSGARHLESILGDSIPPTTYRVTLTPRLEGGRVIELEAGTFAFR